MNPDPGRKKVSDRKKTLLWILYLVVLTPICLELALRVISAKPYIQTDYHIEVSPPNAFSGNDSLGIVLNPGTFNIVLNNKVRFQTTHTRDGLREVIRPDSLRRDSEIAVMGCSFTYGYGVNDNETAVSILQKKYPKYKFDNYGVIGYGTLQSYFQLEQLIENEQAPDIIILNFASDHLERNALSKKFRRAMKIGFDRSLSTAREMMISAQFPYLTDAGAEISYEHWNELYEDWWGRENLASVNFIQTQYDLLSDKSRDLVGISTDAIDRLRQRCAEKDIKFVVMLLDDTESIRKLESELRARDIITQQVGFDFNSPEFTNVPHDIHPNARGQQLIAKRLEEMLKKEFLHD